MPYLFYRALRAPMPPKKKPRKQGECVEVVCKFSECEDVLVGSQQFLEHVELHVDIMRNQLDEILLSLADTAEEDTGKAGVLP